MNLVSICIKILILTSNYNSSLTQLSYNITKHTCRVVGARSRGLSIKSLLCELGIQV